MTPVRYEIRGPEMGGYKLVSIVKTMFGLDAVNFVTSGTPEHCAAIKERLEMLK